MPDGDKPISVDIIHDLTKVEAAEWDACAGGANPFLSWAFLQALEESGSVGDGSGWFPHHLIIRDPATGALQGAAPLYLKLHSYGEYIFDHSWAHAYESAGGRYYPKLQCAVPFTPATGPRLLVHPQANRYIISRALIRGMRDLALSNEISSVHVTFPEEEEWETFGDEGWLQRTGLQYHWENDGYEDFDGFLAALSSRKRKAIRKERSKVAETGIAMAPLTGDELKARHWDVFYRFYRNTTDRKWGEAYLTRDFFAVIGERMPERIVLMTAQENGDIVAGALNFVGEDTLFGRNWGCTEHHKFLHFETCYYQAIDYAITSGLKWVEAGAQGEHKIQRGYLPRKTFSAHFIGNRSFRSAVDDFLSRERPAVDRTIAVLMEESPFRQANSSGC